MRYMVDSDPVPGSGGRRWLVTFPMVLPGQATKAFISGRDGDLLDPFSPIFLMPWPCNGQNQGRKSS